MKSPVSTVYWKSHQSHGFDSGGKVNLRTIRPLELEETLGSLRVQVEDSSLTTDGSKPRYSGAWGDKWTTDAGEFGVVISGSVTEQEAVSFRPRTDRDNIASPAGADPAEFLGIQFLVQEQENDDYETTNLATTFEWAPNDNLKFHMDVIINEQERSRDQYRLQASGVSSLRQLSIPTAFETIDFGVGPFPQSRKLLESRVSHRKCDSHKYYLLICQLPEQKTTLE